MRRWTVSLAAIAIATVVGSGPAARIAAAQNPLDYIKKKADEAKKKADEISRKADSANKATAAAKAAADSMKNSLSGAAQQMTTTSPTAAPVGAPSASNPSQPTSQRAGSGRPPTAGGAPPPTGMTMSASTAKVDAKLLVSGEPGLQYWLSPRGQHAAAVVLRGSRQVVVYDGVEGPKFDDIATNAMSGGNGKVIFSDDGSRFAYVARASNEWIVMVDGKELARGTPWSQQTGSPTIAHAGFSPGTGHHFWFTMAAPDAQRPVYRVYMDGKPEAQSTADVWPSFSANGERYAYVVTGSAPGRVTGTLIIDGKPSAYPAGAPIMTGTQQATVLFTADAKHAFTAAPLPNGAGTSVFVDGAEFMRVPNNAQLYPAPVGSAVLGVVWTPIQNGRRTVFLTVGNKRVPGSDCDGSGGLDRIYWSSDGKHWAARCEQSGSGYWVMADGKKGRSYAQINSDVVFTSDGRPVYQAAMNQRMFLVVGDDESNALGQIDFMLRKEACEQMVAECGVPGQADEDRIPATIRGTHVGFTGKAAGENGFDRIAVVDGKSMTLPGAIGLVLSPDGSRYAFLAGTGTPTQVVVDGKPIGGVVDFRYSSRTPDARLVFSPDGKHLAFAAMTEGRQQIGVAIDGRFVPTPSANMNFNLTFTPDSKHLVWAAKLNSGNRWALYVDGQPAMQFDRGVATGFDNNVDWSMGPDGTLTFVAQENGNLQRWRVTPQ